MVHIFYGDLLTAALFTFGCFFFDYADGLTARALNITGPLGKELDSLADMVSFGVVPGAILYHLLALNFCSDTQFVEQSQPCYAAFPAFILSAAAGLRLGKFNIDTRQTKHFLGLTTPACTVFVMGLGITVSENLFGLQAFLGQTWVVALVIISFSALMLCEVPMFGMKLKPGGWRSNKVTLLGGISGILVLVLLKAPGLSLCVLLYIIGSMLFLKKEAI